MSTMKELLGYGMLNPLLEKRDVASFQGNTLGTQSVGSQVWKKYAAESPSAERGSYQAPLLVIAQDSTFSRPRPQTAEAATSCEESEKNVMRSRVVVMKEVPVDSLSKVPDQNTLQNLAVARATAFVECYVIFAAVTTLMIVTAEIRSQSSDATIHEVGETNIDVITRVIAFGALPFLFIVLFRINNYFSERMYYKYLQRGVILDFPLADCRVYHRKIEVILFLMYFVAYSVLSLAAFLILKASVGNILIFLNNLFAGILLFWYRNQTIELSALPLVRYIESFRDVEGNYDNVDDFSLSAAAEMMQKLRLAEAEKPSYTGEMRGEYYRTKGVWGTRWMWNALMYLSFLAVVGLAVFYYSVAGIISAEENWKKSITPCVRACITLDSADLWSVDRCKMCVCHCLAELSQLYQLADCSEMLKLDKCPSEIACPASC